MVVKGTIDSRARAVLLYLEGVEDAARICKTVGMSRRTLTRWVRRYKDVGGIGGLEPHKPGPKHPSHSIPKKLEDRIVKLKQKHPSWGATRIKYQYDLPCHWTTVHRVIKRCGMLIRIKAKPQPSKRFQRYHVDSMWQGDSFEFRIAGEGKAYVTGFTDDRSRYRVKSGAYRHKSAKESVDALKRAVRKGRVQREMYLDNGKQFIAKEFKAELALYQIKPIYGKPYHPRGRRKIEGYHKVLWNELISQVRFSSLGHFKRELRKFDRRYNYWRKSQALGWKTPSEVYNDAGYLNKRPRSYQEEDRQ